jgi:hypothetical protein
MSEHLDSVHHDHNGEPDDFVEDEATQEESISESDGDDPRLEKRKIFPVSSDPPISALHARYRAGDLNLEPLFQRRKVWDHTKSSKLIESLILEVPLPIFYFAEGPDGEQEVIDGQQRLTACFRFLDNEYPLKGLEALPHLNGKYFKELDRPTQRLVQDSSIRQILFRKESDPNLRFEIFERLNTGAVPLNDQELRNCIYRGPHNDLLISLSEDKDYQWLMGFKGPQNRMKDVEYVLRFAAFYHSTYLNYRPPMKRFLNEDMQKFRNASKQEQEKLRSAFKTAVALVRSLLGEHAFHRFYPGEDKENPDGYWEPKKFNASLYDILMWSFADKDKNQVMANLDAIREALIVLMSEDDFFIEAIELSTSAYKMVRRRFDIWRQTLDAILETTTKQPRCFSRALKQRLYEADPTCAICKQYIADLDDAAVDHIEQYWLGGKTIPKNARLAHRYCNCSRPRKEKTYKGEARREDDQESGEPPPACGAGRLTRGIRTPEAAFVVPILRALEALGGTAPMQRILEKVGAAMKGQLRDVDYEPLKSDPSRPRWNNTAQWARNTMVAEGLLKNNSPRGVWEITAAGRKELRASESVAAPSSIEPQSNEQPVSEPKPPESRETSPGPGNSSSNEIPEPLANPARHGDNPGDRRDDTQHHKEVEILVGRFETRRISHSKSQLPEGFEMPANKGLLGVRHGRKYQRTDGRWVLTTKKGFPIKDFSTESELDSWWRTFQTGQGRPPLPLDNGKAPERRKKRWIKGGAPTKVSEQLNQIMEKGIVTPPHSSGTCGEDFLKPWSEKYDMPEYDLE